MSVQLLIRTSERFLGYTDEFHNAIRVPYFVLHCRIACTEPHGAPWCHSSMITAACFIINLNDCHAFSPSTFLSMIGLLLISDADSAVPHVDRAIFYPSPMEALKKISSAYNTNPKETSKSTAICISDEGVHYAYLFLCAKC